MIWRFRLYIVATAILAGSLLCGGLVGFALPDIHYASGVAAIGFYFTALAVLVFLIPGHVVDRYARRPFPRARRR